MEGAIFSFNNIFTDTNKLTFSAWQKFSQYEFGIGLPGKLATNLAGRSPHKALQIVLSHCNASQNESNQQELLAEWRQELNSVIAELSEKDQQLGIKRLLLNLYDHYVKTAVFDTDGLAAPALSQLGLSDYVDLIVPVSAGKNPYQTAIDKLGLAGADCIGIGTTASEINDIKSTNAIAVGVGNVQQLARADYQVVQVGDLRYPRIQKIWEEKSRS